MDTHKGRPIENNRRKIEQTDKLGGFLCRQGIEYTMDWGLPLNMLPYKRVKDKIICFVLFILLCYIRGVSFSNNKSIIYSSKFQSLAIEVCPIDRDNVSKYRVTLLCIGSQLQSFDIYNPKGICVHFCRIIS